MIQYWNCYRNGLEYRSRMIDRAKIAWVSISQPIDALELLEYWYRTIENCLSVEIERDAIACVLKSNTTQWLSIEIKRDVMIEYWYRTINRSSENRSIDTVRLIGIAWAWLLMPYDRSIQNCLSIVVRDRLRIDRSIEIAWVSCTCITSLYWVLKALSQTYCIAQRLYRNAVLRVFVNARICVSWGCYLIIWIRI